MQPASSSAPLLAGPASTSLAAPSLASAATDSPSVSMLEADDVAETLEASLLASLAALLDSLRLRRSSFLARFLSSRLPLACSVYCDLGPRSGRNRYTQSSSKMWPPSGRQQLPCRECEQAHERTNERTRRRRELPTTYEELAVVLGQLKVRIAPGQRVADIDIELGERHRVDFHGLRDGACCCCCEGGRRQRHLPRRLPHLPLATRRTHRRHHTAVTAPVLPRLLWWC